MGVVRTIAGPVTVEIDRVKGSRFVADLWPVGDEGDAEAMVAELRRRHPDATHHCWAFRLADGRERASDDGEPRDTAGAPILRHLAGAGLGDVACVVTRWFGGTKLGRGGLIRAYGDATATAIAAAEVVEVAVLATFDVRHPYDLSNQVQAVLAEHEASVVQADYGADVTLRVALARARGEAFGAAIIEATSGRVTAVPRDPSRAGGEVGRRPSSAETLDEQGL